MDQRQEGSRADERGKPASFDRRTGEVHGSGSGAGGGNPREDFDSDPTAGAGQQAPHGARPIERAVERPIDPDEGV
jgi:hypothetical protein